MLDPVAFVPEQAEERVCICSTVVGSGVPCLCSTIMGTGSPCICSTIVGTG